MTQLPRYSIKIDASATGVQVGMAADPAGEYVRVDELQFFVTQFFGKQPMEVPAIYPPEPVPAKPATSEPAKINMPAKKPAVAKKAVGELKSGKFEESELDFLVSNCCEMTSGELAAALNKPNTAVQTKLWQLSLKAKPSSRSKQGETVAESTPEAEPVAVVDPQPAEEFDPSNPFVRPIPESAKLGSGRLVSWS